jgi:hypothetical protein
LRDSVTLSREAWAAGTIQSKRYPDVDVLRIPEGGRHDADDGGAVAVQHYVATDDIRIRTPPLPPECVADDGEVGRVRTVFPFHEDAASTRLDPD